VVGFRHFSKHGGGIFSTLKEKANMLLADLDERDRQAKRKKKDTRDQMSASPLSFTSNREQTPSFPHV
jgi:hypothetical protein